MQIKTLDPRKNAVVVCGELVDGVYFRDVKTKHYMRVIGGYGIQEDAFQQLLANDAKRVILKEVETGKKWYSPIENWIEHGKVADYGHGKQRFLSTKFMGVFGLDN